MWILCHGECFFSLSHVRFVKFMSVPRELPGLYFDQAKNRYFPLSSQPRQTSAVEPSDSDRPPGLTSSLSLKRRKLNNVRNLTERLRVGGDWCRKNRTCQYVDVSKISGCHISVTCHLSTVRFYARMQFPHHMLSIPQFPS